MTFFQLVKYKQSLLRGFWKRNFSQLREENSAFLSTPYYCHLLPPVLEICHNTSLRQGGNTFEDKKDKNRKDSVTGRRQELCF
jgi:hypothetical protein